MRWSLIQRNSFIASSLTQMSQWCLPASMFAGGIFVSQPHPAMWKEYAVISWPHNTLWSHYLFICFAFDCFVSLSVAPLRWRHNGHDNVSNHQPHYCLLNRLFRRRSKKTSKLRGTGLCVGNSPGTGEFPAQMDSNAENVSIWWRHHGPIASSWDHEI